ncbi:MAG: response regulator [Neptuniibacter sp.]
MDITLSSEADDQEVVGAIRQCGPDDAVCCLNEESFKRAKVILVQEQVKDVTIQLLDTDGYAIRQVTSKQRDKTVRQDQLNDRQRSVIRALEKVLIHCKKEGIQLVGYSDELVALPAHIPLEEVSSAGAVEVESTDVYKGADAILPEANI